MGSKGFIEGHRLADDQSLAANFNSNVVTIKSIDNVGIVIETSSVTDNTGTFGVDVRIKKDDNTFSSWVGLTLSSTPTLANADDQFFINLNQLPPCELRVTFTAAGSVPDGTCDIWVSGKQV